MSLVKVAPAPAETKAEEDEDPVEDDEPDDEDTLFVDNMIERLIKVRHAKARTEVKPLEEVRWSCDDRCTIRT